ncbi:diacylglycerol kinase [Rhodobacter calidifons]|uniref:Diacylglycerol kinase n=1 Tax=Rhodobacter calidifons TaxID=2715277 RepID=A0ABX0G2V2_9RHOB|nr:diacylglycerol kinase [Rhodobacter calidifons]NHB75527.1 diacylglycerol kinase [Rhodobacter calidifons]
MRGMLAAEARRLANTVIWSWDGFRAAWATEKTLRQWTLANVLSAALAFSLDLTPAERGLILALGFVVLAAELINTAIEEVVDMISPVLDPRAKKAKDCGSACVALAALAAGLAWVAVLLG